MTALNARPGKRKKEGKKAKDKRQNGKQKRGKIRKEDKKCH
jgi:hypothetical protein